MYPKAATHPCWIVLDLYALSSEKIKEKIDLGSVLPRVDGEPETAGAEILRLCALICNDVGSQRKLAVYLCSSQTCVELLLKTIKSKEPTVPSKQRAKLGPLPSLIWTAARPHSGPACNKFTTTCLDDKEELRNISHAEFLIDEDSEWQMAQRSLRTLEIVTAILEYTGKENVAEFLEENENYGFLRMVLWLIEVTKVHFSEKQKTSALKLIVFWTIACSELLGKQRYRQSIPNEHCEFIERMSIKMLEKMVAMGNYGFRRIDKSLADTLCTVLENLNAVAIQSSYANKVRSQDLLSSLYYKESNAGKIAPCILEVWRLFMETDVSSKVDEHSTQSMELSKQAIKVKFCQQAAITSALIYRKNIGPKAIKLLQGCWAATFGEADTKAPGAFRSRELATMAEWKTQKKNKELFSQLEGSLFRSVEVTKIPNKVPSGNPHAAQSASKTENSSRCETFADKVRSPAPNEGIGGKSQTNGAGRALPAPPAQVTMQRVHSPSYLRPAYQDNSNYSEFEYPFLAGLNYRRNATNTSPQGGQDASEELYHIGRSQAFPPTIDQLDTIERGFNSFAGGACSGRSFDSCQGSNNGIIKQAKEIVRGKWNKLSSKLFGKAPV